MNFLSASAHKENGLVILSGNGFHLALPPDRSSAELPGHVIMGVRPEDLDGPVSDAENALTPTVSTREQLGHALLVYGTVADAEVVASLDPHQDVHVDTQVHLKVNLNTLHVFDPETQRTLI